VKYPNKIADSREDMDLSREYLATYAKVSRRAIGYYENGEKVPNVIAAILIARALKTTVEDLFQDSVDGGP